MQFRSFAKVFSCLFLSFSLFSHAVDNSSFAPTIPVVDMQEFYNPETKQKFVDDVSKALSEVGFFALVNSGIDMDVIETAYQSAKQFFNGTLEQKKSIFKKEVNGQRGYIFNENAQGNIGADLKEFVHTSRERNIWPDWMDLETPLDNLLHSMDVQSEQLQRAFALAIGEDEEFFIDMTKDGDCLLRTSHYPVPEFEGQMWAAQHTDIDFFTILPLSTEDGLQLFYRDEWIDVRVPPKALIINGGDKMQNLTNGLFKSGLHRVVSKLNTERYSVVYFIHPKLEDSNSPTEKCIQLTGGVKRYPDATSLEILARRLVEIGLASDKLIQFDKESGFIERVQELVEAGVAADPVKLTYEVWLREQNKSE